MEDQYGSGAACHRGGHANYRTNAANTFFAQRFQTVGTETPGNGTHWNMAADEGRMEQWEGPIEETARAEDALVLELAGLGFLRLARGESGVSPETGKSAGPGIDGERASVSRHPWPSVCALGGGC